MGGLDELMMVERKSRGDPGDKYFHAGRIKARTCQAGVNVMQGTEQRPRAIEVLQYVLNFENSSEP